jgi:hypothetical protein
LLRQLIDDGNVEITGREFRECGAANKIAALQLRCLRLIGLSNPIVRKFQGLCGSRQLSQVTKWSR